MVCLTKPMITIEVEQGAMDQFPSYKQNAVCKLLSRLFFLTSEGNFNLLEGTHFFLSFLNNLLHKLGHLRYQTFVISYLKRKERTSNLKNL
jgi:hypothetical protein